MAFKLALFHQALAKPDVFLIYFLYLTEDRLFFLYNLHFVWKTENNNSDDNNNNNNK